MTILFLAHSLGTAEEIRVLDELGAIAEMTVAPSVTVTGCNRRSAQRPAMIAAFKSEHQAFAAGVVAHQLERVLDGLGTSDVEMGPTFQAELALGVLGD